jgi:hypothetical protein
MRTSLHDIQQIDDYLLSYAGEADRSLFEARLILQPALQENMAWQQKTYTIIRQYCRRQLKTEIESVHEQLFNEPEHIPFRRKIMALFSKR